MTVPVIEYTDAAQMRADYAARRARLYGRAPVGITSPGPVPAEPEPKNVSEPAPDPLALYRLAYNSVIDPKWGTQVAKRLIKETAEEYGLSPSDIYGHSRIAKVARARQLAAWRIAKQTELSMPRIARLMGGRDHTTVLHSIRRINEVLGENVRGVGVVWRGRKRQ